MFKSKDIINGYVETITMDIKEYGYAILNIECIELNIENDLREIAYKKAIEKQIFVLGGLSSENLKNATNKEYETLSFKFLLYITKKINKELKNKGYKLFKGCVIDGKKLNDMEVAFIK